MSKHGPEYEALAVRLKAAREKAGLTQADVALRLGKPQSFVSKIESGERRIDVIELVSLARIYGKSLEYFIQEQSA